MYTTGGRPHRSAAAKPHKHLVFSNGFETTVTTTTKTTTKTTTRPGPGFGGLDQYFDLPGKVGWTFRRKLLRALAILVLLVLVVVACFQLGNIDSIQNVEKFKPPAEIVAERPKLTWHSHARAFPSNTTLEEVEMNSDYLAVVVSMGSTSRPHYAQAQRSTYGRRFGDDVKFVVYDEESELNDVCQVCETALYDEEHLVPPSVFVSTTNIVWKHKETGWWCAQKRFLFVLRDALQRYRSQWYLIVDDDSFVVPANLRAHLAKNDPSLLHYMGDRMSPHWLKFVGGGGGHLLSRALVDVLLSPRASMPGVPTSISPPLKKHNPGGGVSAKDSVSSSGHMDVDEEVSEGSMKEAEKMVQDMSVKRTNTDTLKQQNDEDTIQRRMVKIASVKVNEHVTTDSVVESLGDTSRSHEKPMRVIDHCVAAVQGKGWCFMHSDWALAECVYQATGMLPEHTPGFYQNLDIIDHGRCEPTMVVSHYFSDTDMHTCIQKLLLTGGELMISDRPPTDDEERRVNTDIVSVMEDEGEDTDYTESGAVDEVSHGIPSTSSRKGADSGSVLGSVLGSVSNGDSTKSALVTSKSKHTLNVHSREKTETGGHVREGDGLGVDRNTVKLADADEFEDSPFHVSKNETDTSSNAENNMPHDSMNATYASAKAEEDSQQANLDTNHKASQSNGASSHEREKRTEKKSIAIPKLESRTNMPIKAYRVTKCKAIIFESRIVCRAINDVGTKHDLYRVLGIHKSILMHKAGEIEIGEGIS
eukprot:CFRG0478T1